MATWAFDLPTCFFGNKTCLLRLLTSIVSIQINQVNVGEAGEHEVSDELAADAAHPHHQDPAPSLGLSQLLGQPPRRCNGGKTLSHGGG